MDPIYIYFSKRTMRLLMLWYLARKNTDFNVIMQSGIDIFGHFMNTVTHLPVTAISPMLEFIATFSL